MTFLTRTHSKPFWLNLRVDDNFKHAKTNKQKKKLRNKSHDPVLNTFSKQILLPLHCLPTDTATVTIIDRLWTGGFREVVHKQNSVSFKLLPGLQKGTYAYEYKEKNVI